MLTRLFPLPALPSAAGGQDRSSALRPSVRPRRVRLPAAAAFALGSVCVCGLSPSLTSVLFFSVCHSPLFSFSVPPSLSPPPSSFFHHSLASSPLLKGTTATQTERERDSDGTNQKDIARSSVVSSTYSHSYRGMPALRRSLSLTPTVYLLAVVSKLGRTSSHVCRIL